MSRTASKVRLDRCLHSAYRQYLQSNQLVIDGLKVVERFFNVPLDHSDPQGEKIRVFARHIIPKSKAKTEEEERKLPFRECY